MGLLNPSTTREDVSAVRGEGDGVYRAAMPLEGSDMPPGPGIPSFPPSLEAAESDKVEDLLVSFVAGSELDLSKKRVSLLKGALPDAGGG